MTPPWHGTCCGYSWPGVHAETWRTLQRATTTAPKWGRHPGANQVGGRVFERTLQIGNLDERRDHYIEWGLPVTPNLDATYAGIEGLDWGHGGGHMLFGTPRQW